MSQPFLCPVDQTPLTMSERQGVEIDYCPTCRGVWLDRGELDKIIEKNGASQQAAQAAPAPASAPWSSPQAQHQPQQYQQQGHYGHKHPHKRRKSFLEELFD